MSRQTAFPEQQLRLNKHNNRRIAGLSSSTAKYLHIAELLTLWAETIKRHNKLPQLVYTTITITKTEKAFETPTEFGTGRKHIINIGEQIAKRTIFKQRQKHKQTKSQRQRADTDTMWYSDTGTER